VKATALALTYKCRIQPSLQSAAARRPHTKRDGHRAYIQGSIISPLCCRMAAVRFSLLKTQLPRGVSARASLVPSGYFSRYRRLIVPHRHLKLPRLIRLAPERAHYYVRIKRNEEALSRYCRARAGDCFTPFGPTIKLTASMSFFRESVARQLVVV